MEKQLTKGQAMKIIEMHAAALLPTADEIYKESKPKKAFLDNLLADDRIASIKPYLDMAIRAANFKSKKDIFITVNSFKKSYKSEKTDDIMKLYSSLLPEKTGQIIEFTLNEKLLQAEIDTKILKELLKHGEKVHQLNSFMSDTVANSIVTKLDEKNISLDEALSDPFALTKTRTVEMRRRKKSNYVPLEILSNEQADALSLVQKDDYYRFYNTFVYTLEKILKDNVSTFATGVLDFPYQPHRGGYKRVDDKYVLNQVQVKINRNCSKLLSKRVNIENYKDKWLQRMQNDGIIRFYNDKYFFEDDFLIEYELELIIRGFVENSKRITASEIPAGVVIDGFVTNDEGVRIELSKEQLRVAKEVGSLKSGLAVVTGRAGSGKTTVTEKILQIRRQVGLLKNDDIAIFCAPMGIASKRLGQALGEDSATTIHSAANQNNLGEAKLVVIDETGFADMHILLKFLKQVNKNALIIFLGDKNQLAPVDSGMFLRDVEENIFNNEFNGFNTFYSLGTVFRQGKHSNILTFANNILDGKSFSPDGADLIFEPEVQDFEINDLLLDYDYYQNYKDTQVLSIMKEGQGGVKMINSIVQKNMHKHIPGRDRFIANTIKKDGKDVVVGDRFYKGDKIVINKAIYTKDNDGKTLKLNNGELGYIQFIADDLSYCLIELEMGVFYIAQKDLGNVILAYCTSVHKTQGGGWKNVIFLCQKKHIYLATRNLLYTGVTRAKKRLIMCSEPKTLATAVYKQEINTRQTDVGNKVAHFGNN